MATSSFLNIPCPEQGASIITLSKYPLNVFLKLLESVFVIIQFLAPNRSKFSPRALILLALISLETNKPVSFSLDSIYVDFPPGAAHISRTFSPSLISAFGITLIAEGSCK